ncbi:hypothetical protein ACFL4G_08765 [Thermodesulfobacteriota bacterium]
MLNRCVRLVAVFLLLSIFPGFPVTPAYSDVACEIIWDYFSDFPGYYWTVLSGEWEAAEGRVSASASDWGDGYWAISHSSTSGWGGNYAIATNLGFQDEVVGEITVFLKLDEEKTGYAVSLDGDNDSVRLWEARIHDDGTVDDLKTLAIFEDVGFVADHDYRLIIDHYNKIHLSCSLDGVFLFQVTNSSHGKGDVAIGYIGPGSGFFDEFCVDAGFACFLKTALTANFHVSPLIGANRRYLMLSLMLIGLTGVILEYRARIKRRSFV